MKDIKQYFTNDKTILDKKMNFNNVNKEEQEQEEETVVVTGKRKRVKIRISRDDSASRMCNIIENQNDLIDKTPNPLNGKIDDHTTLQDGTPRSCLTESAIRERLKKRTKPKMNEHQSEDRRNMLQEKERKEEIVVDNDDSVTNFNDKTESSVEFHDDIGSQREESNAFQVLMSRNKPINYKQYKLLPQQSIEDTENKEKSDHAKELKSKYKEKLIALADKKGYSKKKLAELEESERIERNIENRIRFFKGENKSNMMCKKENSFEESIKNSKSPGNLLSYFSKSSLLTNKNEQCVSTFIVKADVHRSDSSDTECITKPISNKRCSIKKCSKSELDLSMADDIQILASENLFSPSTIKENKQKREKPRWSLRIRLQSSGDNSSLIDTEDELFSSKSKSKFNVSSKSGNSLNIENKEIYMNDSDQNHKKIRNKKKKEIKNNISNDIKDDFKDASNGDINLKKSDETNKTKQKVDNNETIITLDDSDDSEIVSENILKRKVNENLAPLFIKRRKTDPAIAAARRLFLQSNMVDLENKNIEYKMNNSISMLPFPTISHVTQLENESNSFESKIKHKFPIKIVKKYLPLIDINNYKYIINCRDESKTIKPIHKLEKKNIEQALSEMEKFYPDVRQMWETISTIKNKSEKKSQMSGRKTRKKMLIENDKNEDQSRDCAWMYKYKPMSAQELVGNEKAAVKLKDWLSGWRTSLTKEDGSSGDEFYSSDCSSTCNNENNQIAVLLGPHGSGKSASVYAIAEELGYSVLEVNASSRRTGRRLLKELEEATKSHRIKKNEHKSPFERITNDNETSKISQNSLILLEDIDLIFEEDEGFISAAYQLASNTKRPIVMTCRDICLHLNKMAPQQNKVYFHKVSGNRVSALLELISLAETGYRIPNNCLMTLLQAGDLRQALLQLQYLLLSGPPILSKQSTTIKPSLWQDMQYCLYKPAIKLSKKQKIKKSTNSKKSINTCNILNDLVDNLDHLSLMSSLIHIEDMILNMSDENVQPNLSLAENISFYSSLHDLNADIANFINNQILYKNCEANEQIQNQSKIILKKQLNRGVDLALSHITSTCLDQRVMALDYLPTARTICRAEESRSSTNYKRGSRFFHYLHSLKVPTVSIKPNILATACTMLQEKETKTICTPIFNTTSD